MSADKELSRERKEILALRARVVALEDAMMVTAAALWALTGEGKGIAGPADSVRADRERRLADPSYASDLPEHERAALATMIRKTLDARLHGFGHAEAAGEPEQEPKG